MKNLKKEIQEVINLYQSQKISQAESMGKKLLKNNPKISYLYNLIGLILSTQKKNEEAIQFFEQGLNIQPDYAMIYNNLGNVYKYKKEIIKAEQYYKKSTELDSNLIEGYNNLGNLYIETNKYEEAIGCFKKCISKNFNFYIAHYNLGVLYKSLGKLKESKKFLMDAIKVNPGFFTAHRTYSQITKYKSEDHHLKEMKKIYETIGNNASGKAELLFGLGKAYDDLKNYKEAFLYYKEGNKLRRTNIEFSLKKEKEEFTNIKNTFNQNIFKQYKNISNNSDIPIFIVGMPRSGTTLTEQIISSHSKVFPGDELNFFNQSIKKFFFKNKIFNFDSNFEKNKKLLKTISDNYIADIKKVSSNSLKVTDKLPINFKWIGFIKLLFPKAKIIHCERNPKDTCISIYKNYFTNVELNYAYDFHELVEFYKLYKNLMEFWYKNFPKDIITINYEKLIKNPNKEIQQLIMHCDLKWEKNCLNFYNNKRIIKTASDTQVRNKIYSSSINTWKCYERFLADGFKNLPVN